VLLALSVTLAINIDLGPADAAQGQAEKSTTSGLHITVLEGEDGVNILKSKMAVKPVIEVRDKNNLPVADAAVVFLAPDSGPHVTFAHGSNTFMTTTDANGRAAVSMSKPAGRGPFKIKVNVDFHGETLTVTIAQTNYITAAAATAAGAAVGAGAGAASAGISGTLIGVIVAGVAAVAVGAAIAATRGGGAKTPTGTMTPTGTIGSAGTPTLSHP
jgi:hypothetical protein